MSKKVSTTKVIDDYFFQLEKYKREYGEKTCVFMQIGSFYELYQREHIGNLQEISKILNIQMTKKKREVEFSYNNPYMCGVPLYVINKYIKLLIEHDFIVVIFDQLEKNGKISRFLRGIYSSSINPVSFDDVENENGILTSLIIEENIVSILQLDNTINNISITEKYNQSTSDIINLILSIKSSEYNIYTTDTLLLDTILKLKTEEEFNINIIKTIPKEYYKIDYQNDLLKTFYSHLSFGLLSPIEFLNLERYTLSIVNLLNTIAFVKNHDSLFIKNLNIPIVSDTINYLNIALDTIDQLNVLPDKKNKHRFNSLFNVVNTTCTIIGKRRLLSLLSKPYKNTETIQKSYDMSNVLLTQTVQFITQVKLMLSEIYDIEKLHRKMGLLILTPSDFFKLHTSYIKIYELLILFKSNNINGLDDLLFSQNDIDLFNEYITLYNSIFDVNKLHESHFFKSENELSDIQLKINNCENEMESIRIFYNDTFDQKGDFIKIANDSSSYYLLTTKIRFEALKSKKCINLKELTTKINKNEVRFFTSKLSALSIELLELSTELSLKTKNCFISYLQKFYDNYNFLFTKMTDFCSTLDILLCNVHLSNTYKYTCPILDLSKKNSFINCKEIRHPIIERVLQTNAYISNDILLDNDNGIILLGYNSSGKSSLLRAIGLNIILAQCGLFVPCSRMEYNIFHKLICQVDLSDNFYKNCSSFITELKGIRYILETSDSNTLILMDEAIKGSEVLSATSIFTSTVNYLSNKKVKFLMTTHLHSVTDLNIIKNNDSIKICHLDVEIKDHIVIFNRKLKNGVINPLYGLEIANTILPKQFMNTCFKVREILLNENKKVTIKKSRYNSKKLILKCEVCGSQERLETHHVKEQCLSDDKGFFENASFHQNEKHNLVSLCKKCHLQITLDKMKVNYISTSDGIKLNVIKN